MSITVGCRAGGQEVEAVVREPLRRNDKRVNDRRVSGRACCWPGVSMGVSSLCGRQEMARPDAILTHDCIPS
jgi:hypothetical protein